MQLARFQLQFSGIHYGHKIPRIECNVIEIATKLGCYTIGDQIKVRAMHK